jgi:hypothetical protein
MTIKRRGIKFDREKKAKEGENVKQNQLKK